jgi:hypothetical protein
MPSEPREKKSGKAKALCRSSSLQLRRLPRQEEGEGNIGQPWAERDARGISILSLSIANRSRIMAESRNTEATDKKQQTTYREINIEGFWALASPIHPLISHIRAWPLKSQLQAFLTLSLSGRDANAGGRGGGKNAACSGPACLGPARPCLACPHLPHRPSHQANHPTPKVESY